MDTAAKTRQEQQQKILQRDNDIAVKFAKLEQWKKELADKVAKKTAEANAAKVHGFILKLNIFLQSVNLI